jgi:hypothetical protein
MSDLLRVYYDPDQIGPDGYPYAWHGTWPWIVEANGERIPGDPPAGWEYVSIKDFIRERDGHRCLRCHHPYEKGMGQWSPCDERCDHGGPTRINENSEVDYLGPDPNDMDGERWGPAGLEAEYRILTVHHLNGVKHDCRWFNLVSLCQRCHLSIQTRVVMERIYPLEHSEWFKPFAAAYYANVYLGLEPTIEETQERLEEFLALERMA